MAQKRWSNYIWSSIALVAMAISFWVLYKELHYIEFSEVISAFEAIPVPRLIAAACCTMIAYTALACYDRIGLMHLGRSHLSWFFIAVASFVSYALSHNIGFSMVTGGLIRYRAYSVKGLSLAEVTILAIFCSLTFALGTIVLGGIVLVIDPVIVTRFFEIPMWGAQLIGASLLLVVAAYVAGSFLHLPPLKLKGVSIDYPKPKIVFLQLIAAPAELLAAAGILYFSLPEASNPGYWNILGTFLASFSAALLSHTPGGLGVLEAIFIQATPDVPKPSILAALFIFRLFYLVIPLIVSLIAVIAFERSQLVDKGAPSS